jgi:hypothetical protein
MSKVADKMTKKQDVEIINNKLGLSCAKLRSSCN